MPGFNGMGPRGMGPMTGRGMGYCAIPVPPQINPNPNMPIPAMPLYMPPMSYGRPRWGMRGLAGRGFGRGRGWRR